MRLTIPTFIIALLFTSVSLFAQDKNTHKFMVTGLAQTSLILEKDASSVETAFEPIFLYKLTDKFLFESEIEAEIEDGGQAFNLEYAQLLYMVSDYLTIGAGRMLNPVNYFGMNIHPAWINKLADKPFFIHEDTKLLAPQVIGFQARGAFAMGASRINYAAYYSNGPILDTATGRLNYDNFGDNNKDKGIGGRIGFVPVPYLEIGAGMETALVGDEESAYKDVRSTTTTFDLNFKKQFVSLKSTITAHGQYITRKIDNPNVGVLTYDNSASGGYGEIALRPDGIENKLFKNLEVAFRYDWFTPAENDPENAELTRTAIGFNYWITPSTVIKFNFENKTDKIPGGSSSTESRSILQFATGL